jgi:hypothetical protein
MSEPEWSLPLNRVELIARCEALEVALRDCVDADSEPYGGSVRAEAIYRAREALATVHDLLPEVRIIVLLKDRIRKLEAALREAKEIVKVFHDIGSPKHMREEMWTLYQQSPEMQRLNAALAGSSVEPSIEPIQGGQLCHLCNAVHDLMSACPPKEIEVWPCPNCGALLKHARDCPTSDRGVAK